jgi:putative SOS response-associated peptidase YedK
VASCTIIVTDAKALAGKIHNRMLVVLFNVAAARPMDGMPVEQASEAPPGATAVEHCRPLSEVFR